MIKALLLALAGAELMEFFVRPRRRDFRLRAGFAWRAGIVGWLWMPAFALTARPFFSAAATICLVAILIGISNLKSRYLGEPLVFSDFAFVPDIVRHPTLFYFSIRSGAAMSGIVVVCIAIVFFWLTREPAVSWHLRLTSVLLCLLLPLLLTVPAIWHRVARSAQNLVEAPDLDRDVARFGLMATLALYTVRWIEQGRGLPPRRAPTAIVAANRYDAVLVIQAEAFVDLRRFGAKLNLPALDGLKARAMAAGLIEVPAQGAYTVRSECAVLTGRGFEDRGFDRYYPYLRCRDVVDDALPAALSRSGWLTLFVHPHDLTFYRRHRAIPAMGFGTTVGPDAFSPASRVGPYVGDGAVGSRLLSELKRSAEAGRPLYAHAVTMEAHDPYRPDRIAGINDPVLQYIHHAENLDRMLANLTATVDRDYSRVLLVMFGDHVPVLPAPYWPFEDARTDFFAAELGRDASRRRIDFQVTKPEDLNFLIRFCVTTATTSLDYSVI